MTAHRVTDITVIGACFPIFTFVLTSLNTVKARITAQFICFSHSSTVGERNSLTSTLNQIIAILTESTSMGITVSMTMRYKRSWLLTLTKPQEAFIAIETLIVLALKAHLIIRTS